MGLLHPGSRLQSAASSVVRKIWNKSKRISGLQLEYGKGERLLLDYLTKNEKISAYPFCILSCLPCGDAEVLLADLVVIKVIEPVYELENEYFRMIHQKKY